MTPIANGGYTQWKTCTGFGARNTKAWRSRNTPVFQKSAQLDLYRNTATQMISSARRSAVVHRSGDERLAAQPVASSQTGAAMAQTPASSAARLYAARLILAPNGN